MKYIIVDLEMNPVAKEYKEERKVSSMEIIEIWYWESLRLW